jgi:alkane 1-monooxygenase
VLAVVPAIWRRVMDPRVLAHFDGDMSRANISPRKRARVLAAYAAEPAPARPGTGDESTTAGVSARPGAAVLGAGGGGRCPGCGYVYDEAVGDPREGFPAGTPWAAVPDTWCCPDCGVREKVDFEPMQPA